MSKRISIQSIPWGWIGLLLLFLQGLWLLSKNFKHPIGDFANYYYASQLWVEGAFDERVYDPYDFNVLANERAPEPVFLNYTPVPPISVVIYSPFALMSDIHWAKCCFNAIGLLLFLLALFRLTSHLGLQQQPCMVLLPIIFYSPILNNFFQGQSYLYLLAFIFEAFCQWQRGRKIFAAFLWSLPIVLKIFPAILLLFLWMEKDKRTSIWVLVFSAILSLSAFAFLPWPVPFDYFTQILPRLFQGQIHNPYAILFQSMDVLLKRCFVPDAMLNPDPVLNAPWLAEGLSILFKAGLLWSMVAVLQYQKIPVFLRFAFLLFAGLLFASYGSSYSLMLALPLLIAIFVWEISWRDRLVLATLFLILCNVPIYRLYDFPWWTQFPRLYAMLLVLGVVLWLVRPYFNIKWGVLFFSLLLTKGIVSNWRKPPLNEYYLADDRYGIIHDYQFKDGHLILNHFNQNGLQESQVEVTDSIYKDASIRIIDDQLYVDNQQITQSSGNKRRPMRLNQSEIIFLSDEGRGVGFFTLRRVNIE